MGDRTWENDGEVKGREFYLWKQGRERLRGQRVLDIRESNPALIFLTCVHVSVDKYCMCSCVCICDKHN